MCLLDVKHVEGMLFGVQNELGTGIERGFNLQAHLTDQRSDHRSLSDNLDTLKRNDRVAKRSVTVIPIRLIARCSQESQARKVLPWLTLEQSLSGSLLQADG